MAACIVCQREHHHGFMCRLCQRSHDKDKHSGDGTLMGLIMWAAARAIRFERKRARNLADNPEFCDDCWADAREGATAP